MSEGTRSRIYPARPLFIVGLILIGLLAGILVTLWATGSGQNSFQRPVAVERVELGAPSNAITISPSPTDESKLPFDAFTMNEIFKQVASSVTPSVVFIQVEAVRKDLDVFHRFNEGGITRSVGSGVIISRDGYVVTNNHVIDGATDILVTLDDKRQYEAMIVGADATTDLAVLKLNNEDPLPAMPFGRSENLAVGEWVLAVGNPFRLTSTVTAGIVSALGRQVDVIDGRFSIESFIQTDAAINPGNSGGALVNLKGELVGISTAIATETGSYAGYGFAVPVNLMEHVVSDLIRFGEVKRGFLGVSITPINALQAERLGLSEIAGVFLADVQPGLAAAEAGLKTGDVLLAIQGRPVSEPNELQSVIALHSPGERLEIEIWRNGETHTFEVTLEGREAPAYQSWMAELNEDTAPRRMPEIAPDLPEVEIENLTAWGVGLSGLDFRLRSRFGTAHGAYIAFVENDGVFDKAGIPRDVLLIAVGETAVFSVDEVKVALEAVAAQPGTTLIRVRRSDGISLFFEVEFRAD